MNLDLAAIRFQILAQKHTHFWVIIGQISHKGVIGVQSFVCKCLGKIIGTPEGPQNEFCT
ncbi:MAG TPA: hypothetical protein DCM38_13570 [Gammaproteobacteria bacterium]|nr:hypothetical protein [Gammaproteobacteria bacterium]